MRTVGVAILGIFVGLVVGFLVFGELVARAVVASTGTVELPWTLVIGFGPQAFAVLGGLVGVVVDRVVRSRGTRGKGGDT